MIQNYSIEQLVTILVLLGIAGSPALWFATTFGKLRMEMQELKNQIATLNGRMDTEEKVRVAYQAGQRAGRRSTDVPTVEGDEQ